MNKKSKRNKRYKWLKWKGFRALEMVRKICKQHKKIIKKKIKRNRMKNQTDSIFAGFKSFVKTQICNRKQKEPNRISKKDMDYDNLYMNVCL